MRVSERDRVCERERRGMCGCGWCVYVGECECECGCERALWLGIRVIKVWNIVRVSVGVPVRDDRVAATAVRCLSSSNRITASQRMLSLPRGWGLYECTQGVRALSG